MIRDFKYIFIVFLFFSIILGLFPNIDISFSKLFYLGDNQFVVQHYLVGKIFFYEYLIRNIGMRLIIIFLLFFPILIHIFPKLKKRFKLLYIKKRDIIFIWFSTAILAFFINIILKNGWGRARPNDTIFFGGDKVFSSWIQYSNECLTNCSFVSGDASVGFFIACLYYITKNKTFFYISIVIGILIGMIRVGAGAHFLSDITMSFLIINFILMIIYKIYYGFLIWKKV